jgi:hypothetical protein
VLILGDIFWVVLDAMKLYMFQHGIAVFKKGNETEADKLDMSL